MTWWVFRDLCPTGYPGINRVSQSVVRVEGSICRDKRPGLSAPWRGAEPPGGPPGCTPPCLRSDSVRGTDLSGSTTVFPSFHNKEQGNKAEPGVLCRFYSLRPLNIGLCKCTLLDVSNQMHIFVTWTLRCVSQVDLNLDILYLSQAGKLQCSSSSSIIHTEHYTQGSSSEIK